MNTAPPIQITRTVLKPEQVTPIACEPVVMRCYEIDFGHLNRLSEVIERKGMEPTTGLEPETP